MTLSYVLSRLGVLLLVLWLAISINFIIPRLAPGDPVEQKLTQLASSGAGASGDLRAMAAEYRARFGLDQPAWKQYLNYWLALFQGDLGYSLDRYPERVSDGIQSALPWTVGLLGVSTLFSFVIGTALGGLMAWPRAPGWIKGIIPGIVLLSAVPYFLLGVILIFVVAVVWKLLPAGGGYAFGAVARLDWETAQSVVLHAILPALAIILTSIGTWALGMRGMLISVLGEDYILLAEAKGLRQRTIFLRYGMRTALLPQVTSLALALGRIVSGAILVEVIFAYPGIGLRLFQAIQSKDYLVIQGIVLVLTVSIAFAMFIMDLLYPLIDPRIRVRRA